jgi:IS5 family transposase
LEKQRLMNVLLTAINDQLSEQGLTIESGEVCIIDASVIEAKQCRPHKKADGSSSQDPDAAWNVKAGSDGKSKSTYGYKAHSNVDDDGLIKALAYSTGNVHDSNHFTTLLEGNETASYADSAYQSQEHTDWLSERGIENRLIKPAYRNRPSRKGLIQIINLPNRSPISVSYY